MVSLSNGSETEFLTSRQVADLLQVSVRTVVNMRRKFILPHLKIGRLVRFRQRDVEAAINAFTIAGVGEKSTRKQQEH
jgi:excisionase family DNA binding protein